MKGYPCQRWAIGYLTASGSRVRTRLHAGQSQWPSPDYDGRDGRDALELGGSGAGTGPGLGLVLAWAGLCALRHESTPLPVGPFPQALKSSAAEGPGSLAASLAAYLGNPLANSHPSSTR